jgi:predicted GTPase
VAPRQQAAPAAVSTSGGGGGGGKAPSPVAGSDVPRVNIGVFGVMNAGKSTLINALTRQVGPAAGAGRRRV